MIRKKKIYIAMLFLYCFMALSGCGRKEVPGEDGELVFLDQRKAELYNKNWLL